MKVRVERQAESWFIVSIGAQPVKISFDQAVMKMSSAFYSHGQGGSEVLGFEGDMCSIHGIDFDAIKFLPVALKQAVGIGAIKLYQLGGSNGRFIRFMGEGTWEYARND